MVNRVLLKKSLRDLFQRRWSILALALIIAVGVGVYVSMSAVYLDLDSARGRYYERYQLSHFTVDLKRAPEWTTEAIAQSPNIVRVRGRVRQPALLDLEGRVKPIPGVVLSLPQVRDRPINGVMLRSGIWFSNDRARETILDHQFAQANNLKPGDRIKVTLLDKRRELLVVGTAMSPEFVYLIPPGGGLAPDPRGYGVMYAPRKFLQDSCDLNGAYNQLLGLVKDRSREGIEDTLELIDDELDPYGVANTTPIQDHPSASVLRDELRGIEVTAAIFPVIFLGVAAMVLNILMSRMVIQHRSVIGTLRALGYPSRAIISHYLGFGLAVGLLGAVTGLIFGWWLQGATLKMYRGFFAMPGIEPHMHWLIYVTGAFIAIVFSLLGAMKGSWSAAGLAPAEAMRPPPPEKGGKVLPEKIPALWNNITFRWKMVIRAVFRNPIRSLVTILASAVATGLILSSFSMYDATYYLMDYHFEKISHEDISFSIRDPKGRDASGEMARLPLVAYSESQLNVVCDLKNGPYSKRTGITGLPRRGRLYTPLDEKGNRIVIPDEGLILTGKLAEILRVKKGDEIRIRPLIAQRREVNAAVVGISHTFLGLSVYCGKGFLSHLLGEELVANTYFTDTFRDKPLHDLMVALKKRPAVIGLNERRRTLDQMRETMGKFMGSFFVIMIIFAGIIAFGALLNTAMVSLSERQREVGALRVIGYTTSEVWRIFSGEGLILNGVGIFFGVWLGVGLSFLISIGYNTELYRFPVVIYPSRVALTIVIMLIFLALAQAVVYRMIHNLAWLDSLKVKE